MNEDCGASWAACARCQVAEERFDAVEKIVDSIVATVDKGGDLRAAVRVDGTSSCFQRR